MQDRASQPPPTRTVFIADDDEVLRAILRLLIESEPGLRVAGEAGNGQAALEAVAGGSTPDILLVDVNMPRMNVQTDLQELRQRCPRMEVVVYSGEDEVDGRRRMGDLGGRYTYVVKGRPERLVAALREAAQRGA